MKEGKIIWETNNSEEIQTEVKKWIDSIQSFHEIKNLMELARDGYCLRIPTNPIKIKNDIMDTTIQDVFLYLGEDHEPVLLLFDIEWPVRYLVHISADVRPLLKKLGIWDFVNGKKYVHVVSSHL
jgi:hypothetical protein